MEILLTGPNDIDYPAKLKQILGPSWGANAIETSEHGFQEMEQDEGLLDKIFCGHCGSKKLIQIHKDSGGSIAGGDTTWEFQCRDCDKITIIWHEWG